MLLRIVVGAAAGELELNDSGTTGTLDGLGVFTTGVVVGHSEVVVYVIVEVTVTGEV